jgi:hypothetical protein
VGDGRLKVVLTGYRNADSSSAAQSVGDNSEFPRLNATNAYHTQCSLDEHIVPHLSHLYVG